MTFRARGWARAANRVFALGLILSAVAKALGPRAAAAGLLWTDLGHTERLALVLIASFFEAGMGGLLLALGRCRPVVWAGTCLAVMLILLHVMGMAMSPISCGCFGDLPVPDGAALALLGLGLLGCMATVRSATARANWRRAACVIGLALAVPALAAAELSRRPASPTDELRARLSIGSGESAVALVGTWSCDDCERALRLLLDRPVLGRRVFFVTRVSDAQRTRLEAGSFVHAIIPDGLWWQFVSSKPPVVITL